MPTHAPTFSAIIPNYNHGEFILHTLEAALGQTSPFHEIIVIDDASTDNSAALIEARLAGVPQARLIRNAQNMGVIRSANLGLKQATGDFICYLSADDAYDRRLVEWCRELLGKYPDIAMISGNASVIHAGSGATRRLALPFAGQPGRYTQADMEAAAKKRAFSFNIGANVIRRDAILAAGEQIEALAWHADWLLYLIVACRHPFGAVPREFVQVRLAGDQYSYACRDWKKQRPVIEALIHILKKDYPEEYPFFRRAALLPTYDFAALFLLLRQPELRDYLTPLLIWRLVTYKPLRLAGAWMPETWRARARNWLKV